MRNLITVYLLMYAVCASASTNITIAKYYNNSAHPFIHCIDDYKISNADSYTNAVGVGWGYGIPTSVACYGSNTLSTAASVAALQPLVNLGAAEVCSHSMDQFNFSAISPADTNFLIYTVRESKTELEADYNLGSIYTYDGEDHMATWIQSYGEADPDTYQPWITYMCATNGYLVDAATHSGTKSYVDWGGSTNIYPRSWRWSFNTVDPPSNLATAISRMTADYSSGYVNIIYIHPISITYLPGSDIDQFFTYATTNYPDLWPTTMGELYMYRYLATESDLDIDCSEDSGGATLTVSCAEAPRLLYGLSNPVTYVYTNETGIASANLNAYYKGQNDGRYYAMTTLDTDNTGASLDGLRKDGDVFYLSASLPQTGTNFIVRIATSNPNRFRPEAGEKLLFALP